MKHIKHFILVSIIVLIATACETPISLTIPDHNNPTVIEGWIENGKPATVVVSQSLSYFSEITLARILSAIDTTAEVIVTDDEGNSESLSIGFSPDHLYGLLGKVYVGSVIKGKAGHTYMLKVKSKGKVYSATTNIPASPPILDNLHFNIKEPTDTSSTIRILIHDNGNEFNCYRFFTQIKDLDVTFSQTSIGVFDDLTFNGLTLNFELVRMPTSNILTSNMTQEEYDNYYRMTFFKGDVVYVKSTTTDIWTKSYWSSLQSEISAGQNPFVTPGTHPGNIEGENVTGIWSGYHARYDTLEFK